jgi:hypothetical protein
LRRAIELRAAPMVTWHVAVQELNSEMEATDGLLAGSVNQLKSRPVRLVVLCLLRLVSA